MVAVIYARVSTSTGKQDTDRQVKELTEFAKEYNIEIAKVFQDYQSGATPNSERRFLQECLRYCTVVNKNVNCVLMSEVSRLGRDVWEMTELAKFFHDHHLNVYFKRENLNMFNNDGSENTLFTTLFAMLSKFAENERTAIKERLKSGYNNYRAKGGKVGRKKGSTKTTEQLEQEYKQVIKELKAGLSIVKVAKLCDVAPGTVAKVKKIFKINLQQKD